MKSDRLRVTDVRAVYLLVGECRELGADPVAWQTHLLGGLMRTLGAAVGMAVESDVGTTKPTSFIDAGWSAERDRLLCSG
ncbi:MAG: hypothetical protein K2X87_03920 [Gemmataceae bacterium]|nr:hypothetical protein [Gemmataceae bacterium]